MTRAAQAAWKAADAVEELARVTSGAGYVWPSEVDAVVAALETMARSLPQALSQASKWLEREHHAGRVGTDRGGSADDTLYGAVEALEAAEQTADALYRELVHAHGDSSRLTGVRP